MTATNNLFTVVQRIIFSVLFASCLVSAAEQSTTFADRIANIEPMDLSTATELDPKTRELLRRYYRAIFGDQETYERIESLRFKGTIHFPDQSLPFTWIKKKPDLSKLTLLGANDVRWIKAFDGKDAWQLHENSFNAVPTDMDALEAINFRHSATIGGHLLYPSMLGKTIQLGDPVSIDGQLANVLHVTLPDGKDIEVHLEAGTTIERRQVTVNSVTGRTVITNFDDYRDVEGIQIPFESTMEADDELIHRIVLEKVEVNIGAASWMFRRPSS